MAVDGMRDDLRKLWEFMRTVSGDDAYERYLDRHARTHPDVPPLSPREFFADEQDRKWSGITRCC
ncbi:MAG: YbdD/YjiX family protein [Burkholderiales bacterium]|nr:YbdD/YjiX family protein [Burkholderiales bacterium]